MRSRSHVSRIFAALLSLTALITVGLTAGCGTPEEKVAGPKTQDGKPIPPEAANAPAAGGFEGGPKKR